MGRFKNAHGVILNIPAEKAEQLGLESADDESTKPVAHRRKTKKDEES